MSDTKKILEEHAERRRDFLKKSAGAAAAPAIAVLLEQSLMPSRALAYGAPTTPIIFTTTDFTTFPFTTTFVFTTTPFHTTTPFFTTTFVFTPTPFHTTAPFYATTLKPH